jgi:hypothetical protein
MLCILTSTLGLLIAMFVLAVGAKLASRYYQRSTIGAVDEDVAVNWQNRVVLSGIVIGFVNFLSHFQFSVGPD